MNKAWQIKTIYFQSLQDYILAKGIDQIQPKVMEPLSGAWVSLTPFLQLCKILIEQGDEGAAHVRQFGRIIMDTIFKDPPIDIPKSIIEGVMSLPHFYGQLVMGESAGFVKIEKVDPGHFSVYENTPFEEEFFLGFLSTFLTNMGGKGVGATLLHPKGIGTYFAKYKVTWMRKAEYEPRKEGERLSQ